MRYFKDRSEAGKLLAEQMGKYKTENCAVLALSEGGILVGAEIAKALHTSLLLLTIKDVTLPRELEPLASMSSAGTFTYNHSLSNADLEEISLDFRPVIDQIKMETFHSLNRIVSKDGEIDKRLLKGHTVILVSDGLLNGLSLDVATDFLKHIEIKQIVVATPLCESSVLDRIHLMADDINCLNVFESDFPLDHYYEDNKIPDHEKVISIMSKISLDWQSDTGLAT